MDTMDTGTINKVFIAGRLGRDPEVRTKSSDEGVVISMSVATEQGWTDRRSGERMKRTEWHRVVSFNDRCNNLAKTLKKGAFVWLEGKLVTRKWTDNAGKERFSTEIVIEQYKGDLTPLSARPAAEELQDAPEDLTGEPAAAPDDPAATSTTVSGSVASLEPAAPAEITPETPAVEDAAPAKKAGKPKRATAKKKKTEEVA